MRTARKPGASAVVMAMAIAGSALIVSMKSRPAAAEEGCTKDVLKAASEEYYEALVTHDASALEWAPGAKVTENGKVITPGQGFWQSAGAARFVRVLYDPESCSVQSMAVMNDGTRPAIVGGRFKIAGGGSTAITESETLTTHSGDYFVFNINGLMGEAAARRDTSWEAAVPEAQRSSREQLIKLADDYFSMFGARAGAVDRTPYQSNCDRWENGFRTTAGNCVVGIMTGNGDGRSNFITHRRYPFVDVENGVVVGYVLFGSILDFHMFKVVGGKVLLVSALVGQSGHTTMGWD